MKLHNRKSVSVLFRINGLIFFPKHPFRSSAKHNGGNKNNNESFRTQPLLFFACWWNAHHISSKAGRAWGTYYSAPPLILPWPCKFLAALQSRRWSRNVSRKDREGEADGGNPLPLPKAMHLWTQAGEQRVTMFYNEPTLDEVENVIIDVPSSACCCFGRILWLWINDTLTISKQYSLLYYEQWQWLERNHHHMFME